MSNFYGTASPLSDKSWGARCAFFVTILEETELEYTTSEWRISTPPGWASTNVAITYPLWQKRRASFQYQCDIRLVNGRNIQYDGVSGHLYGLQGIGRWSWCRWWFWILKGVGASYCASVSFWSPDAVSCLVFKITTRCGHISHKNCFCFYNLTFNNHACKDVRRYNDVRERRKFISTIYFSKKTSTSNCISCLCGAKGSVSWYCILPKRMLIINTRLFF